MSAANSTGIIKLNVGGKRFVTSRQTLTWIPDSFFQSLLSGRIPSLKDEDGAIFIDRDPDLFKPILNYMRSREVQLNNCNVKTLKHEAEFYGITPLVRRLTLCEELKNSSCGSLLFSGLIPPPNLGHMTSHDLAPASSFPNLPLASRAEMTQVIQIESHGNCIAAAYPQYVCLYQRVKESRGWELVFTTPYLDRPPQKIAVNAKVIGNGLGDKMLAYSTGK